jgi:hypothetical protein
MAVITGALKQASKNEWLHDVGELYVQVRLSKVDAKVQALNQGLSEPIMLSSVLKKDSGKGFPNAVICDRGSNIEFVLKSRGARGYGFHVESGKEVICDRIYCVDTSEKPGQSHIVDTLPCFIIDGKPGSNIKVDDWATLGVAQDRELREQYWSCKIYTWPIFGFIYNGQPYGTPRGPAEADVVGSAIHSGDQSQATFGTLSNLKEPDDRQASNNGYLTIYFFSFADLAKKKAFYEAQELGESGDFA